MWKKKNVRPLYSRKSVTEGTNENHDRLPGHQNSIVSTPLDLSHGSIGAGDGQGIELSHTSLKICRYHEEGTGKGEKSKRFAIGRRCYAIKWTLRKTLVHSFQVINTKDGRVHR